MTKTKRSKRDLRRSQQTGEAAAEIWKAMKSNEKRIRKSSLTGLLEESVDRRRDRRAHQKSRLSHRRLRR